MSMTLAQAMATIAQQRHDLLLKEQQIAELSEALVEANRRNERMKLELERLLKRLYGPKAEPFRLNPDQLLLGEILAAALEQAQQAMPEPETVVSPDEPDKDDKPKPRGNRHNHGRMDLEVHEETLPCEDVIVDVAEDEKICPETGATMVPIGEEITRKLEIIPGRVIIRRYRRTKYASPAHPEVGVVMPELPAFPIPRCLLDVGLIAEILVSKYADHKPLYRIERTLSREGVPLSRQTMSGIAVRCGSELLLPLYRCLVKFVLSFDYIFSDDTGMPIQLRHVPIERQTGEYGSPRMWVYGNATGPRQVVYDFTLNRGKEGPAAFLAEYREGYLQADAYAGYDVVFNNPATNVIEVGCNVHARRKFYEVREKSPKLATEFLAVYRALFSIERWADEHGIDCPAERLAIRREKSAPLVTAMYDRIAQVQGTLRPNDPIMNGFGYVLKQRAALTRFLEDGRLRLDNNWAENHMRPLALGRKNFLNVGSIRGGLAAAVIYSFTESCRLAGVNPTAYFKDVLWRLAAHPPDRLSELLPCNWQPAPPPGDRIIMPPMPRGAPNAAARS